MRIEQNQSPAAGETQHRLAVVGRALYWLLPVVILTFILTRIDIAKLIDQIDQANPWLVLLGIGCYPLIILIGASRWQRLIRQFLETSVPFAQTLRHYWIGMAVGMFVPGALGWDLYRVVVMAKRLGNYLANVALILEEKFLALFTCMGMVLLLYPWMQLATPSPLLEQLLDVAYVLFLTCLVLFATLLTFSRLRWLRTLALSFTAGLRQLLRNMLLNAGIASTAIPAVTDLARLFQPLISPRRLLPILLLTLLIQVTTASVSQIFFLALGYDLPFLVNLFVTPIMFFVFLLPISFGGLGIREGTYIVLFGLFGVPPETALLASFLGLVGILLNNAIGGLLIYLAPARTVLENQNDRP